MENGKLGCCPNFIFHFPLSITKKQPPYWTAALCWHLPIFPDRHRSSIFGTIELNFRVRYGNGCTLNVINTNSIYFVIIPDDFNILPHHFKKCKPFFKKQLYDLYLYQKINREQSVNSALQTLLFVCISDGINAVCLYFDAVHVFIKNVFTVYFKVFFERAEKSYYIRLIEKDHLNGCFHNITHT